MLGQALQYEAFREYVKSKALEAFDGDYDFLIAMVQDDETRIPELPHVRTFSDLFKREGSKNSASTLLTQLRKEYPLLQIHVPEIWTNGTTDWNTAIKLKSPVACIPIKTEMSVPAYKATTDEWVSMPTDEAPTEVTVVVSRNERMVARSSPITGLSGSRGKSLCPEPGEVFGRGRDIYYYRQDLDEYFNCLALTGGGNGGNPPGNGSKSDFCTDADRVDDNGKEVVSFHRLVDMATFRHINEWWDGRHEIVTVVTFANSEGGVTSIRKSWLGTSGDLRKCTWLHCDLKDFNGEFQELLTWDPDIYGGTMKYVWFEEDKGTPIKFKFNITPKFKIGEFFEIAASIGFEVDATNDDDRLGEHVVEYCDRTRNGGTKYKSNQSNGVYFYVKQK